MIKTVFRIAVKFALFKTDGILNFVRKTFFLAVLSLTISVFSLIVLDSINNGYKDISVIHGGITSWIKNGNDISYPKFD